MAGRWVEVSGHKEAAAQIRAILERSTGAELGAAVYAGALVIQNDAKRRAPVRTGNLRRSIHTERGPVTAVSAEATVGTDVEYAAYQELGTRFMAPHPYLRPAADHNDDRIEAAVVAVIDAAIAAATGGV